ncbi:MAG: hypothetical protein ABIC40_04255, partial [bacterium]
RNAMFTANVTRFLQPPISPINMVKVAVDFGLTAPSLDYVVVDVTLHHPFPGLMIFRGFDVRGILMGNPSQIADFDSSLHYANWSKASVGVPTTETVLLNADGYARWWNPNEFTTFGTLLGYTKGNYATPDYYAEATLNPYKYFTDELGKDDQFMLDPANRGTFSVDPGYNTRRYEIQFSGKPWKYNYAIDASWAKPDTGAPDYPVDVYPTEANMQEAYAIKLTDAASTVYYQGPGITGGMFDLNLEIFDWQAIGASANPSVVLDEISNVWIESPAITDGAGNNFINVTDGDFELLPGSGDTSAILHFQVEPDFSAQAIDSAGDWPVLIAVESSHPDSYEPQITGGGTNFDYPDAPLAAYVTAYVPVAGISTQDAPEVIQVIPDKSKADVIVGDVQIIGKNFMNGATVQFDHAVDPYSIGPIVATFVNSTLLEIDLDLNGAHEGFYDVTVENPDLKTGTLEDGFEVTNLIPILVLEDEITFDPFHAGYDNYTPAICEEIDGDIVFTFEEYTPAGNTSYASARKSQDDGDTWPDVVASFVSFGGSWRHGDADKIWPSSYGTSYRTLQLVDPTYTIWATGFFATTFTDPWPDGAHVTQNISHFTEILQDAEKYVYTIGDKDGYINFKRSEVPEYIMGGPSGAVWASFPVHTIVNNGYLSRARSSALWNGKMYLAYFEPTGNVIRLAHEGTDWQNWDTSTVIWDGADTGTEGARDPGLQADETGFHVTFTRGNISKNMDELCYTHSDDGTIWSEPVVIHEDPLKILDTPICRYDWDGLSTLGTVWWTENLIWAAFSIDDGATWSAPVQISELSDQNKQPDLVIANTENWHFVFAGYNPDTSLNEIHYRRGHMEWQ